MPHPLDQRVGRRLEEFTRDRVIERLWSHDHTLWAPEPTEIADRLGWLRVDEWMRGRLPELEALTREVTTEGYRTAVVLGMGGSSLAAEVFAQTVGVQTFGHDSHALDVRVCDTTDPQAIAAIEQAIDLDRTLFIVASKSGTTLETLSHFAYFWERVPDGRHFVAITDPGTALEALAREREFRHAFLNPQDIGGRFSALSYFGMVPAALAGADLAGVLSAAEEMREACMAPAASNPGARLGVLMAEAALMGRDKLTLVLPAEIASLGAWIEQLIAESTGKQGRGIIPVVGEPLGPPEVYGDDRLFVAIGAHEGLAPLRAAGHPVEELPASPPPPTEGRTGAGPSAADYRRLGAEFFRWQFATAIAGHILGINPFDQPNVQEAKDATARILAGTTPEVVAPSAAAVLHVIRPGDYIALQAYLAPTSEVDSILEDARLRLRNRYHVATTVGYGPRFLHSTGQLHKGGPDTCVCVQVIDTDLIDLAIPGRQFTFGALKRAQAAGDLASLQAHGRRVARVTLEELKGLSA